MLFLVRSKSTEKVCVVLLPRVFMPSLLVKQKNYHSQANAKLQERLLHGGEDIDDRHDHVLARPEYAFAYKHPIPLTLTEWSLPYGSPDFQDIDAKPWAITCCTMFNQP